MKKILFVLCALLFVILMIPRRGAAEAPSPTPPPDALVAQALAAKQASYPAWVGDEVRYMDSDVEIPNEDIIPKAPETVHDVTLVVYQNFLTDNWEIHKFLGINGNNIYPQVISNHPASDIYPRLNRGATRIVFATNRDSNYEIYTMDPNGESLARLTINGAVDSQPQWYADGSKIVFASARDGNAEIYAMNEDGSGQTRLTNDPSPDVFPTISPDGSQIAWLRASSYGAVVWIMNSDGTGQHPISPWLGYAQHLTWSPDGYFLAWDADITGDSWNEVLVILPDGTGLVQISASGNYLRDYWMSSWTPLTSLIITDVDYELYDEILYIENTSPFIRVLNGNASSIGNPIGPDINHSAESVDIVPPISQVEPLPLYSRADGFFVNWSAQNIGDEFTGLYLLNLQTRMDTISDWVEWKTVGLWGNTNRSGSEYTSGNPGDTIYYRSQAIDGADNLEDWPAGNGDAFTTLFSTLLTGKVTDGRGNELPNMPMSLNPTANNSVVTDFFGRFTAWLKTYSVQNFSINHPAYGNFLPSLANMQIDQNFDLYLAGQDNVIENGDFELEVQPIPSWSFTGTLTATLVVTGHTGIRNVSLGYSCGVPCLTPPQPIDPEQNYSFPRLTVGDDGKIHLMNRELAYYQWSSDTGWTNFYQIPGVVTNYADDLFDMALDQQGNVHIVWVNYPDIYYIRRSATGEWTTPLLVAEGSDPRITTDSQGKVYLVYFGYLDGAYYKIRNLAGNWDDPILVAPYQDANDLWIVVDQSYSIHIFYVDSGGSTDIYHKMYNQNGELMDTKIVAYGNNIKVALDSINRIHLIYRIIGSQSPCCFHYMIRNASEAWSTPEVIPVLTDIDEMVLTNSGEVHLIGSNSSGVLYSVREPEIGWSRIFNIDINTLDSIGLALTDNGALHLVWRGYVGDNLFLNHIYSPSASQPSNASLSQSVTIPAEMNKPTLSFMYQLAGDANWIDSGYTLEVTNGTTTTQIISSTAPIENWTLGWTDMSEWAGQTVTVTFTLHQAPNEPYIRLFLDDVSLGSWLTPVPASVDITHIPLPSSPVQITITGENFIDTPTVKLNDTPLENIQWIDENTLQATVPANLTPGRYNLWVTNPGGQTSVLAGAILVGEELFLPIIVH